jgi:acyl-CoA dehydrogenase
MNLEVPNKFKGVLKTAYTASEVLLRPISRKYDVGEHTYPKELDILAAALSGANHASGGAVGGATTAREVETPEQKKMLKNGGNMANCLNIQGISYGDVGLLLSFPGQGLGNAAISAVSNDEQLKRFGKLWAAMAITEPNVGSDSGAITCSARKEGDFYYLTGEKIFVTSGERADCVVVWATLDKELGKAAIKSFIVLRSNPGMRLERVEKKLGIRASDTAAFVLTDCKVPASDLLGNPEVDVKKGFGGVMETFDNTRPFVAAMALGCMQASLERTREILSTKLKLKEFKTPINKLKAAEAAFFRLEADYEAARLLVLRAAWMADNRIPNSMEASICKAKAGRVGVEITLKCIELCSSLGYSYKELLEKWGRDSKILDIFEGTQQIQQLIIARRMLGIGSKELK